MFKNVKDWIKNFDRELWIIKNNVAELIKHQKKVPRTKNKKKLTDELIEDSIKLNRE